MKSIAFFASYFNGNKVPVYVKYYLEELARHFSKVVFIANEKVLDKVDTDFLASRKMETLLVANEGYDFGMWYKGLQKYDVASYERVALVNDSCVLFGKLDAFFQWLEKEVPDFAGFTDSYLINYHIQSYFLVANKGAIADMVSYFNETGIKKADEVIGAYEIGLSQYLISEGKKVSAMYPIPDRGKYNYALDKGMQLIENGFPLVKKKIITRGYKKERWWSMVVLGFDPFPGHYIKRIEGMCKLPDGFFSDLKKMKGVPVIKFYVVSMLAICSRIFRNKSIKHE